MPEFTPQNQDDPDSPLDLPPGTFGTPLGLNLDFAFDRAILESKYKGYLFLLFGALVASMAGLIYLSFHLPKDSFRQELSVVLASGIATFLATPIIIKLAARSRPTTSLLTLVLSVACGTVAYFVESPLRSLLVEAAIALILVLVLELFFHRLVETLNETHEKEVKALELKNAEFQERKNAEFQEKVDDWEQRHEVVGHGFGSIDQYEDPNEPNETENK